MATATLKSGAFTAGKTAGKSPKAKANLLSRFWNALMEAQLRKAQREINLHLRFISDDSLKQAGFRRTLEGSKDLPFVK